MRIQVLGQAIATVDGESVDLGARKPRSIVATLAMTPGRPVAADTLADVIWDGSPPRAASGALHAYLSGLRKALDPGRASRDAASVIETTDHGYVLRATPEDVDAHAFATEARACERLIAPLASQLDGGATTGWPSRGDVLATVDRLDAALALWRGEPYADLPAHPSVVAERGALGRLRAAAEEARLIGLLALGDPASVLAATEPLTSQGDLRERVWALHALALARIGRQAEALDAVRRVRTVLADELGLDPGAELRAVETAILQQSDALHRVLPHALRPGPAPLPPAEAPAPAIPTVVGRHHERQVLWRLLAEAAPGAFRAAELVGEPGIGKSWLVADLVATARTAGYTVGVGRCSQDDGAPPLWPWRAVLADLGTPAELDDATPDGSGAERRAFLMAERIHETLLGAADRPTLVVLEDLHWADDASLRALTHVLDRLPDTAPVTLVVTRRSYPEPVGAGSAYLAALARRRAERLDLAGLSEEAAGDLVQAASRRDVPRDVVERWHARTEGNPYFLVELARLGDTGDDEAEVVPWTVRDVVGRRLSELPESVLETLRTAAVVGRRFHVVTLAAASDRDLDEVSDDLETALSTGLVRETGVEEFAFTHALTRDAVHASLSGTGAARRHARVASAMEQRPEVVALYDEAELVAERALHWLAAGASHVDRAWRAAREAAGQARRLTAYAEAMRLRAAAVEAHRRVPGADLDLRFNLLLELATDAAHAARWPQVEAAAFEAIGLARSMTDPTRVGVAAAAMTAYCVWTPHELDRVYEDAIEDLRWALAATPEDDLVNRSRLQLSLAVELYYAPGARVELEALVESGVADAVHSGDPDLVSWAASAAWVASWTPGQLDSRERWTSMGLAEVHDDDHVTRALLLLRRALESIERGDRVTFDTAVDESARLARDLRLHYVTLTILWLRLSLAGLRGERDLAAAALGELTEVAPQVAIPMQDQQAPAAATVAVLWDRDRLREILPLLWEAQREHGGLAVLIHLASARAADPDDVRRALREHPIPVEDDEYWSTLSDWSMEAEAAAVAGDVDLARRALEVLEPYRGGMTLAGAVLVLGPVDGYVALARWTTGDDAGAAEAADAAERLAVEWELTSFLELLRGYRARWGF